MANDFFGIAEEHYCHSTIKKDTGALACILNAEIGAVLAVMRRNARWSGMYVSGDNDQWEHSLIHSLKSLRRSIFALQQPWHTIDPSLYLKPFLDVIRSDETGAPITGVALSAVYKILALEIFDSSTVHVHKAMHEIVEAVTSCRFEVTDSVSEEVVLMKILQVLMACMKHKASKVLSDRDVCLIVNTCFRVVHQAATKGELLQRTARHTMHEIVRAVFAHLPVLSPSHERLTSSSSEKAPSNGIDIGSLVVHFDTKDFSCSRANGTVSSNDVDSLNEFPGESYGIVAVVEIFRYLCSLLTIVDSGMVAGEGLLAMDEDVPLFALGLLNSAVELGGWCFSCHVELLALVQDELFYSLMQLVLSMNPLILSMVCSIVLNLYHYLRRHLKLQLEAFFSCIILRLAHGKYGATYQQQEVAMEALVDFCRQPTFLPEMYANFDCELTCCNVFEELGNLLSKSAFPVNCPLSPMHILSLEGLVTFTQSMAERVNYIVEIPPPECIDYAEMQEYTPFWTMTCENYKDPRCWVEFVKRQKFVKRKLMVGADHFNRDPKKGLEFLQGIRLLPEKLDPRSVACFFRYTTGLDKGLVGDFLGEPDEFCLQVLLEFSKTFDFQDMGLDTALRIFLETFRLPGEAQKIHRILESFAERYYEQSPQILANKDAAFVLAYSVIMLNTDQHNSQVRKKMKEEDFIKNNRNINAGQDLPREYLSELYHSIVRNEIKMSYNGTVGICEMTPSRWIELIRRSHRTAPYITCDSRPFLDQDMFSVISGPTIAAISVVFDHAEEEEVLKTCVDGFLAVAKISANHHLEDVLDDLVVSLCKFTTLLNPTASVEEQMIAFGDDTKAQMAAVTVFNIANIFGDYIRVGWRNILDCILRLHKLGLLPPRVPNDAADDWDTTSELVSGKSLPSVAHATLIGAKKRSSGLMGRFSQLLSLETDEPRSQPTEQQLAAHQRTLQTIENCNIHNIFTESKFLQADSLLQLARALVWAAGKPQKGASSYEDEDTAIFCLELLITVALNNRDRIMLLWQGVFEHIQGIVQTTLVPCLLVEKAVFGLLRICQRLLPYKEELAEDLLRSLQLILKLDARVADVFCERITREVMQLVRANAGSIKSPVGWRTVSSLLSITARHSEASEVGFEGLSFIMAEGAHLSQANYVFCLDAARAFTEARVGGVERSLRALDLMAESVKCIVHWSNVSCKDSDNGTAGSEGCTDHSQEHGEMWMRLVQGLRKICQDSREEVRNYAVLSLQRSLSAAENIQLPLTLWAQCFDQAIFVMVDDLLEIALNHSPKEYRNMESTLHHVMKLLAKIFLQFLDHLSQLPGFHALWLAVLNHMQRYMKAKLRGRASDKLQELIPELLKNMLLILHARGVLVKRSTLGGDSLWELTWHHVQEISPSLQADLLAQMTSEQKNVAATTMEANLGTEISEPANDIRPAVEAVQLDLLVKNVEEEVRTLDKQPEL